MKKVKKGNNRIVGFIIILMFCTFVVQAHLNQPLKFTFEDGSYIEHRYRSDGTLYERIERERVISTVNGNGSTTATYKTSGFTQVGDFIIEDHIPTRMYIEGGYVTLNSYSSTNTATAYNYYVHDNQGSVRAVLNEQGELTQATDYSAYGVPSTRYAGTATNNHLHLGLEWQTMKGVSGYYNNARFRDALLAGMFYQQDRLSEKYYPYSPYHYGKNNPNRYTDISGDSVAILSNGLKHIAMLIQQENKWKYYSINGDVYWKLSYGLLGLPYDNLGERSFDSPEEFLNSAYNQKGSYINSKINTYGYDKAYIIATTPADDQIMIESFKNSSSKRYDLLYQNCATAVGDALNKVFDTNLDEVFPSDLYENIINLLTGKEIIYKDETR